MTASYRASIQAQIPGRQLFVYLSRSYHYHHKHLLNSYSTLLRLIANLKPLYRLVGLQYAWARLGRPLYLSA